MGVLHNTKHSVIPSKKSRLGFFVCKNKNVTVTESFCINSKRIIKLRLRRWELYISIMKDLSRAAFSFIASKEA